MTAPSEHFLHSDLCIVSYNAQMKCSSANLLCTNLDIVSEACPQWDVAFISEFDSLATTSHTLKLPGFEIFRHWPGDGSHSMAFVLRDRLQSSLVPRFTSLNRSIMLELTRKSLGPSLVLVAVHGPHDELYDFFADISFLLSRRASREPTVLCGD